MAAGGSGDPLPEFAGAVRPGALIADNAHEASGEYIAPEDAVDVARANAERWIDRHPGWYLVVLLTMVGLFHTPGVGWLLRRLTR